MFFFIYLPPTTINTYYVLQTLARGICDDRKPSSNQGGSLAQRLPWPLTPLALAPPLLAALASTTTNHHLQPQLLAQLLAQLPLTFLQVVLLALLHLGAALAYSSNSSKNSAATGVRTRRQSLSAAGGDGSAFLRRALVRLLLDAVALAVLAQGVAYLLLLRRCAPTYCGYNETQISLDTRDEHSLGPPFTHTHTHPTAGACGPPSSSSAAAGTPTTAPSSSGPSPAPPTPARGCSSPRGTAGRCRR